MSAVFEDLLQFETSPKPDTGNIEARAPFLLQQNTPGQSACQHYSSFCVEPQSITSAAVIDDLKAGSRLLNVSSNNLIVMFFARINTPRCWLTTLRPCFFHRGSAQREDD
jgi:hypothetical protein